jgi:HlyD family secretion protein
MKKLFIIFTLVSTLSCSKKISVETVTVSKGFVETTVSTINSGTVEAKRQAELAFGTVGRISSIHLNAGAIVNEGTIIAQIENADLKAVYDEADKEYFRSLELFKNGLVSISNLDSAKRMKEVARINLEKTIIKAPFKGMITSLNLKVGEFYQNQSAVTNKPTVQIIDLEKRIVKGEIDEIDLNSVKNNQKARIKIPALKNKIFEGIVKKVVPFVSTAKDQDRTSQIELELTLGSEAETLSIPVGASADVEIITDKKENSLIIPTAYLHGVGNNKFVYKVNGNKLEKTPVTIGVGNYERSEIKTGIFLGDKISRPPEGIEDVTSLKIETNEKKWP